MTTEYTFSMLAQDPGYCRMAIELEPGEAAPEISVYALQPPDGYRWETDDEFRQRILEHMTNG